MQVLNLASHFRASGAVAVPSGLEPGGVAAQAGGTDSGSGSRGPKTDCGGGSSGGVSRRERACAAVSV